MNLKKETSEQKLQRDFLFVALPIKNEIVKILGEDADFYKAVILGEDLRKVRSSIEKLITLVNLYKKKEKETNLRLRCLKVDQIVKISSLCELSISFYDSIQQIK